ncbi:MAG: LPS export ABC transporter permease LptF [Gammaproteobacteria bacterium]|nr:LPS export ABC transporter permease LptF [Gammaproteobacteria bacterium]
MYAINALSGSQCDNASPMSQFVKKHLSIIDHYISEEIIISWISVLFVLVMVVISADAVHLLAWLVDGRIPVDMFFSLLLNNIYEFTVMLVPLSLLLGILLAFGRLYKDSEMTAVMSAGLGPIQWYRPLLLVAVPITLLMFYLTLFAIPSVVAHRDAMMTDIKNRTELSTLFAGRFNQSRKGNAVFFLETQSEDRKVMDHVFYQQVRDGIAQVDIAKRAQNHHDKNGRDYMVMESGTHYEGKPGSGQYKITEYQQYGVYIPGSKDVSATLSIKALPSAQLWRSNVLRQQAELQWRLTVPIATLIIALLALPLSQTTPRSGRYANLGWAILLYLVYSNLLSMSYNWIIKGRVPAWIGTWWIHILALILLFVLLKQGGHVFRSKKITNKAHNGAMNK